MSSPNTSLYKAFDRNKRILIISNDETYGKALAVVIMSLGSYNVVDIQNQVVEKKIIDIIEREVIVQVIVALNTHDTVTVKQVLQVISTCKRTRFMLVVKNYSFSDLIQFLSYGVANIVDQSSGLPAVMDCLQNVDQNRPYLDEPLLECFVSNFKIKSNSDLTNREIEVLSKLVYGKSYKAIADELNVGFETVKSHLKNIYVKLNVKGKQKAIQKAVDMNLVNKVFT
ncbi:response regulator transcription factor [Fulvivirga sp. M361]|uniref:response regulator transcription factor n=1 Tax=Fulvivirga sp. M361 TaxID=2594266 RepID=UPI00117B56A2|nr:LuxR C-terminal-related transcriptional regulator [Fulvivirga sp. M361]TRX62534.1 response regulator transcription factor [Fulvivirga sp. M361]